MPNGCRGRTGRVTRADSTAAVSYDRSARFLLALELVIISILILLNGVFALAEFAVVNARKPRLAAMAESGRRGARAALALSEDSGRFLPTVQIGITLVSILTGTFSGAPVSKYVSAILAAIGLPRGLSESLGFGVVVAIVTYLTIVIGELVPKRVALRSPEVVACWVAPPMTALSRLAAPAVWLLEASTALVFRLLRLRTETESAVTDEEIHSIVAEAEGAGIIEPAERTMISGVMRLGDRPVRGVMTPRTDIDWIDLNTSDEQIRVALAATQHSRLPVCEGTPDGMLGVVQTRELLHQILDGGTLDVRAGVRPAPVIPDTAEALDALAVLRSAEVPMALVHDEYGHFEGIVTPADLLEAIAGVFRADADTAEPAAERREDGSWRFAGWLPVDEMAAHLAIRLPADRNYHTVAGYILAVLRRLPRAGEHVEADGWRFEVVNLDGHRIDRLVAVRDSAEPQGEAPNRPSEVAHGDLAEKIK